MAVRKFTSGDVTIQFTSPKYLSNKEIRAQLTKLLKSESVKDLPDTMYYWTNVAQGIYKSEITYDQDRYGNDIARWDDYYCPVKTLMNKLKSNTPIYLNGDETQFIIIGLDQDKVKEGVLNIVFKK